MTVQLVPPPAAPVVRPVIAYASVTKSFGTAQAPVHALAEITAELRDGEFVSIVHLDKVFLGGWKPPTSGTYADAEDTIREQKRTMTVDDVRRRAGRAIEAAVANGVTRIRTNVDVDTVGGLTGLHGVLAARRDYADLADIQVVALAHGDLLDGGGGEPLVLEAMKLGADVVGGSPRQEMDDADSARHIDKCFEIARQFDAPIDFHVDAACDPQLRGIHYLATNVMGARTVREMFRTRADRRHVVRAGRVVATTRTDRTLIRAS